MTQQENIWQVLLVEDDEDDFVLINDLLKEIKGDQYRLKWVMHKGITVELACSKQFDICMIDHHLGAITGFDLLDDIKAACQRAPVIFMTGYLAPGIKDKALESGAYAVIEKGRITPRLLERAIQGVIRNHQKYLDKDQ